MFGLRGRHTRSYIERVRPGAPVLVVDDDGASRDVLAQALSGANLPHVTARSSREILETIDEVDPSLVLLDLGKRPSEGYEVLRKLRANPKTRSLPVIVLADPDGDKEVETALENGADDFVRKPCKPIELIARLRGQLRFRGAVSALERREKDSQLVLELTQALASNLDFRSILFTVVQRIAEVANVDRVSTILVRDQGDIGYVIAASDDEQLRDLPIDLSKYPEIQRVLTSHASLVIQDASTHPLLEIVRHEGHKSAFSSLAILPIIYQGKPLGVLFLRSHHAFTFGEREIALCTTIANAMAIALRNARVMQSLRDQTQQVTVARFEAERRLRTLQRYADFFESTADGIVVFDTEGHLLFSNPKAREITGFGEEDLRGRRVDDFFAQEEHQRVIQLRIGFTKRRFPQGMDIRLKRKDGKLVTLSVNFNSVLREDGVVLCSFRDVTEQRALEAELTKTKDFLQRVIDASVDAVISADMLGRVLLFNRAAERIYGRNAFEMLGTNVRQLYPEGAAREVMRMMRSGGGRVEGFRTEIIDAGGAPVPVSVSAALLYEGESPIGSVGVFTDLREKMRMEQRLQQAQERLIAQERQSVVAELAGAAAHELNQPLTSVMGYAELLTRRLEKGTAAFGAAEVIFNEAERMAEIVRKIGKITKYETKSYVGRARIVDLDKASDEEEMREGASDHHE